MSIAKSLCMFLLAAVCEIGGGYLIWLWIKLDKPLYYGIIGGFLLVLYGIIAAMQVANFARVYATYGGIFIVLSLLWAYLVDDFKPDKYDLVGAAIALLGVCIICYFPRHP